jgi:hypothetical protein
MKGLNGVECSPRRLPPESLFSKTGFSVKTISDTKTYSCRIYHRANKGLRAGEQDE